LNLLPPRWLRFVLVGCVNTALYYGIYASLLTLGWHFAVASLAATLFGIVSGFRLHGALVFGNREWWRIGRYALIWTGLYLINVGLVAGLHAAGLDVYSAGAVSALPIAALSYLLQKRFTF
jgi:putative flippase GtrA